MLRKRVDALDVRHREGVNTDAEVDRNRFSGWVQKNDSNASGPILQVVTLHTDFCDSNCVGTKGKRCEYKKDGGDPNEARHRVELHSNRAGY
jgi:hypothetical protein